jgi:transglutaminase-like putative cysteine protease
MCSHVGDRVLQLGDSLVTGFFGRHVQLDVRATDPFNSDTSTVDTIRQMIALANVSAKEPLVASVVDSCLVSLSSHPSKRDLARAIWWWVKNHVTFREDEEIVAKELGYTDPNQELLIPPITLLQMPEPMGDCDDFSLLTASLLKCAHVPCWFVAIAVDEGEPQRFSHVYVRCYLDDEGSYMAMDTSHGMVPGWETSRKVFRRIEWAV